MVYFTPFGYNSYGGLEFAGPGTYTEVDQPNIQLGRSYDSVSTTVPPACGDLRDQMIAEYRNLGSPYRVHCDSFRWVSDWLGNISFYLLTPDESPGYRPYWAVLQYYMDSSLKYMQNQLGGESLDISSGYRNPQAEVDAARQNGVAAYMNSRHLAGDAADLRTYYDVAKWRRLHDLGIQEYGCVEPASASSYSHLHVDFRLSAFGVFGNVACAANWRQ